MHFRRVACCAILLCAFFISFSHPIFAQTIQPFIPDGALIQQQGDTKVYALRDGQKRWITTEQAFLRQGFRWLDILSVDPAWIAAVPEGPTIAENSPILPPVPATRLPDLAPAAPSDIRFSVEEGRTRLRFMATFWNRGNIAFELNAEQGAGGSESQRNASQKLIRMDGSVVTHPVGVLFWHDVHQHYHYDDFGTYTLELVRPRDPAIMTTPIVTAKTTFCMRDDLRISAPTEGPAQLRAYSGCTGLRQGVSVGWADVYPSTLPDQYFDVTGMPAGIYKLDFNVDPSGHFAEIRRDNNTSATFIEIDPTAQTLRVIGNAAPYESSSNRFPDNTLIRSEWDGALFLIHQNRKRPIRNGDVLRSYNLSNAPIYTLPKRAVDVIPPAVFVRVAGTSPIYALNAAGFKRRILNPEIFRSYGWSDADVTTVSQAEFDSMPSTDLVVRIGDERIYSLSARRQVGTFPTLRSMGLDPDSVHGLTQKDFHGYTVSEVASGLNIPWDVAFLPDGDMLVTERPGTLRRIGNQSASFQIPSVFTAGEGGLMGIAVDPAYGENHFIYLYYTSSAGGRKNRITRFRLDGTTLIQDRILLDDIPSATYHDGGQIDFGPDGALYVVTGDAQNPDSAQDLNSIAGKTLRLNTDGSIPSGNPFGNLIWSYGHRNPQGLAWDEAGRLYETEHGPTGEFGLCCRDELNRIEKGANYGWPVIRGNESRAGMMMPVLHSGSNATWAPSGMTYADGRLFFAGLRGSTLYRAVVDEYGTVSNLTSHLTNQYGRLRAVVLGPDGALYITTSNRDGRGTPRLGDDKIVKVHPGFLD